MIIMKFGGTSVGGAAQIQKVSEIVSRELHRKPLIVVSALSGVTNHLLYLIQNTIQNKTTTTQEFKERHLGILRELDLNRDLLSDELDDLNSLIQGIRLIQECSARTQDRILSFGERCSAKIVAGHLSKVLSKSFRTMNSYDLGLITHSQFGNATPLKESSARILKAVSSFENDDETFIVTTGYIAKDSDGNITTLGRGGSDYTASLFGAALNAEEIQIWTDVNGIMTADPRVIPSAQSVDVLSFEEASELAYYGAKVIHPSTMLPAMEKNIPVRILNTNNPSHPGTRVYHERTKTPETVKAIAHRSAISVIHIVSTRMLDQHGFLFKIFEVFKRHQVSVDMVSTSEVSVSITIPQRHVSQGDVPQEQNLTRVIFELKEIAEVSIEDNLSVMSVVGEGLREDVTIPSKVFSVLTQSKIPVRMISLGASKINLSFVLETRHSENALRLLHQEFFKDNSEQSNAK